MDIVALRIFTYSILPLIVAVAQIGVDKSSRSRERKTRPSCCISLVLVWREVVLVAFSATSSSRTRSPNPSAGRPGILFSSKSPLPIWQSVFLELSRWAAGMGSVLIGFLAASRRAERSPDSEAPTSEFDIWRRPRIQAAGLMTGSVAAGFGVGFATDQPVIGTVIGTLVPWNLSLFTLRAAQARTSRRSPRSTYDPVSLPRRSCDART